MPCLLETLARFRPDLPLLAQLDTIDGENDFVPLGFVLAAWLETVALARRILKVAMPMWAQATR